MTSNVRVTLNAGASSRPLLFNLNTESDVLSDGASVGSDPSSYPNDFTTATPSSTTGFRVSLPAGETSALLMDREGPLEIQYQVLDDALWDGGTETFRLDVASFGAAFPAQSLNFTVADNDTEPTNYTVTLDPATIGEGDGATTVTVTLQTNGASPELAASGSLLFQDDTATLGTDVTESAIGDTGVAYVVGETSLTRDFTVTPTDDTLAEGDETLRLRATFELTPGGGFVGRFADLTIIDDDAAPSVSTVEIGSSAGLDDTYAIGDQIRVSVTFDAAVAVTGTPQLELTVGAAARQAGYSGGGGSAALDLRLHGGR